MPRYKKQSRKVKEADKNNDLNAIAGDSPQQSTQTAAIANERSQSSEQDPYLLLQDDIPSASEIRKYPHCALRSRIPPPPPLPLPPRCPFLLRSEKKEDIKDEQDYQQEVLKSTRIIKKCGTSWPKFELQKPWPGYEDYVAFEAVAAGAVLTDASLQALEGFDPSPKRRLKLLLRQM
ncbi:MAG: hypothetical protein EZS28_027460, partial [Streblomastix strix]